MKDFFALIRRIAEPAMMYKTRILLYIFYRVFLMVSGVFVANSFGRIVELTSKGAPFDAVLTVGGQTLAVILVSFGLVFVSRGGANPIMVRMTQTMRENIMTEYFRRETLSHEATGKTLAIFENGLSSWQHTAMRLTIEDPINIVSFIIAFIYLLFLNITILPVIVFYMAAVTAVSVISQRYLNPLRKERKKIREDRSRVFVRSIMEKRTIVFHNAFEYERKNLEKHQKLFMENMDRDSNISGPVYRFPQTLLNIIRVVVGCFFAYEILHARSSLTELVTSGVIFGLMDQYFQNLIDSYQIYTDEYVTLKRLWDFLDESPVFTRMYEGNIFIPQNGSVELKNVSYAYAEGERQVLRDFSLAFAGGKKTALVGRSGAGKSTIVKLILGLMEPTAGEIHVDGQDLMKVRLDSYFPYIGYLSQDPSVFDGTIRENLTYGLAEEVSDERLFTALDHARCDFVRDFELGLLTEIGEKGVRLSGGERQRLAIARIFLRNPEILILDEPTSALDSFSEAAVTDALHELFENKTVIIVAHRLQTVKEADAIIVLGRGSILETGTHEELLRKGGEYSKMVDLQSGTVRED